MGLALLLAGLLLALPGLANPRVTLGVEVLLDKRMDLLAGKRVGLLTNPSAVDRNLVTTLQRFQADKRIQLTQLYAPEHGLEAALANGQSTREGTDARTGIPVEGLFGKRTKPSQESLRRIDVLVFDVQDIGSRTYTYVTSLGKAMQACAEAKVPIIVLDRPNPLGGYTFEGPIREQRWKSLIGWGPLPVTHGMTVGELARFYVGELKLKVALTVVQMEGWQRTMQWEDTGLDWVPPSPGIPKPLNAHLYVATGMVGGSGANVNEGGGNSMPFELIGAPFVDPHKLKEALQAEMKGAAGVEGAIKVRPMTWKPYRGQFAGKIVHGVQIFLHDRKVFRPLRTALVILAALKKAHPEAFKVSDVRRFARVWGNERVLPAIQAGKDWRELEAGWTAELASFADKRGRYLMYP